MVSHEIHRAIELFAALAFLAVGLSHLLQPDAWVEFFVRLREQGRAGVLAEGLLTLAFGALVVSFHNVWSGLPVVLTVIGWAQVAKGLVRLLAPRFSLRVYQRVAHERAWQFRVSGVFALAIAGVLGYVASR